jgi:hypothetical protein
VGVCGTAAQKSTGFDVFVGIFGLEYKKVTYSISF